MLNAYYKSNQLYSAPCYGCDERKPPDCHSYCEKYKEYLDGINKRRTETQRDLSWKEHVHDLKTKIEKRNRQLGKR